MKRGSDKIYNYVSARQNWRMAKTTHLQMVWIPAIEVYALIKGAGRLVQNHWNDFRLEDRTYI